MTRKIYRAISDAVLLAKLYLTFRAINNFAIGISSGPERISILYEVHVDLAAAPI